MIMRCGGHVYLEWTAHRPLRLIGVVLRMVLSVEADAAADRMHLFYTLIENSPLMVIRGAHQFARMVHALT